MKCLLTSLLTVVVLSPTFAVRPDWGDITASKTGDTLYLHVLKWPETGSLVLEGANQKITSVTYLANATSAEYVRQDGVVTIQLPSAPLNPYDTVIKVTINP